MKANRLIVVLLLLGLPRVVCAQGFVNLNFESANVPSQRTSNEIPATNAFPGWDVSAPYIYLNDFSLSGDSISLMDSNSIYSGPPIQGRYYALFRGASTYSISLGQTGQVPLWAQTITYWGNDQGFQITFSGQLLTFGAISNTANYTVYGADISAFAGQTGQLLFTAPPGTGGMLDNIRFSSTPVPEPNTFALVALGASLLGLRRWKHSA
jgi:hypothetical protein